MRLGSMPSVFFFVKNATDLSESTSIVWCSLLCLPQQMRSFIVAFHVKKNRRVIAS